MPRVLIVEDSPTQAQQITFLLEESGFEVESAGNGVEALKAIERRLPDAVVTDLEMPEMNGLQLVEALRRDYPPLPVVLMTAHGSEGIAALALRVGAASYVPKAFLHQNLIPALENVLAVTHAGAPGQQALAWLARSECEFVLPNEPGLIAPVVSYLDDLLARLRFGDANQRMRLGVALREALLNAMDHGNLEVGSEYRQEDEGIYQEHLRQRRQEVPYRDRRVYLKAVLSATEARFGVRDEGPGFDQSALADPTDPANLERVGGRGVLLMRTFMDEVTYNASGNEVVMRKVVSG